MRYLISYIRVSNLLLLALAGGVAFLTFVAVGRVFPGEYIPESPDADEPYPFSLTPEFPVASAEDEAALRAAVNAFLTDTEWSETYKGSEDWDFRDVAVLTIVGGRVGVYGDVAFPAPVSRDGSLTFIRCGRAETWQREGGPPFRLGGLHVRLMDGDAFPWQVLPLDVRGEMPGIEEIRRYVIGFEPCR